MNKSFMIDGQVVEAPTAEEAFEKVGKEMPDVVRPYSGFGIQCFLWSAQDVDFSIEDCSEKGPRYFPDWQATEAYYDSLTPDTIENLLGQSQVRVDLVIFNLGYSRVLKSKVLISDKVAH